jgi:hypothetical protein
VKNLPDMKTTLEIGERLPPVSPFELKSWNQTFGTDYYGALQVAAAYCGLSKVPPRLPGNWQHGTWPPWQKIQAEVIVYNAPKAPPCFVARPDEAEFLKQGGYRRAEAIGLPIIYTQPSGLSRIPNSLLVMPTHSLASDVLTPPTEQYVREIASIKDRFSVVAACVSAYCIERGLWVSEFKEQGIQSIRGAGIGDVNALKRMRALFETFEYVTTDSYGSHVYYAMYFGAKISIWGTAVPVLRENVLSDAAWTPYPEAVDILLSEETDRAGEVYLAPLRVAPWVGVLDVDVSKRMLGDDCKLSPEAMRKAFGWTPLNISAASLVDWSRRSRLWKAGSATKRRLRKLTKAITH